MLSVTALISFGISFLGLSTLIALHELGHFLACRLFGIPVPTFSIGFGPILARTTWKGTQFVISAIPLGGFVEIAGSEPEQETNTKTAARGFAHRPFIQKLIVMLGGIAMNIVVAYGLLCLIFSAGAPASTLLAPATTTSTIAELKPDGLADRMGLRPGDELATIRVQKDGLWTEYTELGAHPERILPGLIHARSGDHAEISFRRAHEHLTLTVPAHEQKPAPAFNITFLHTSVPAQTGMALLTYAGTQLWAWMSMTCQFLRNLVSKPSLEGMGGPLGIIVGGGQGVQQGLWVFLAYMALISVNLAVINFVPLPVFDGGQIVIALAEAIIRRPLHEKARGILMIGTWVLLLALFALVTLQDISRLIW